MPCNALLRAILLAVSLGVSVGCGPDFGNRQSISGTVKLKGTLLDEGVIEFHPLGNSNGNDPVTMQGSVITNGAYTIPREFGLVPGRYKILITSGDGKTPANNGEPPGPTGNFVSVDRIPAEYNVDSKKEVEVKNTGNNVFNFDIP